MRHELPNEFERWEAMQNTESDEVDDAQRKAIPVTTPIDGRVDVASNALSLAMHVDDTIAHRVARWRSDDAQHFGRHALPQLAAALRAAATEITKLRAENARLGREFEQMLQRFEDTQGVATRQSADIGVLRAALSEAQQDNKKMAQDRNDDLTEMEQMERDLAEARRKAEALERLEALFANPYATVHRLGMEAGRPIGIWDGVGHNTVLVTGPTLLAAIEALPATETP